MSHQLKGWTAIEYAERHGGTLQKYADPTERALKRVSIEKAKRVAREDAGLIHMTVKSGNTRKRNPARQTKAAKREKTRKASVERRVAAALAKFLKQANPAMKTAGAAIQRLKGGVLKITPIKANAAGKKCAVCGQSMAAHKGKRMGHSYVAQGTKWSRG